MKKLKKIEVYNKLYYGELKNLDKNLTQFIKNKKIISKQNKTDPIEFEY